MARASEAARLAAKAYQRACADLGRAHADEVIPFRESVQMAGGRLRSKYPDEFEDLHAYHRAEVEYEEDLRWIAAGWDPGAPDLADVTRTQAAALLMVGADADRAVRAL